MIWRVARSTSFWCARRCALISTVIARLTRRAIRAETFVARVAAIRRVLDNLETHVRALSRRLRRGLSRRFNAFTRVPPHALLALDARAHAYPHAAAMPRADTS